jgi:hypothetical protein
MINVMLPQSSDSLHLTDVWLYDYSFVLTFGCTYDVLSQLPVGNSLLTYIFDSELILFYLNMYLGLGQLLSASLAVYILDVILSFYQYLTLKPLCLPLGFCTELGCD